MSTTVTMTPAEFLGARITEGEVAAIDCGVRGERHHADRLCRESEAKRNILREFMARDGDMALMLGPNTLRQREWSGLRLAVLIMAATYSDHPDYREEWRP